MYNEDQPRDEIGRWTDGGGGVADPSQFDATKGILKAASDEKKSVIDEKSIKNIPDNLNHNTLKEILDKAQITNRLDVSYKNGSHYWVIDGEYYRVSDHTKPMGSFGEETYRDKKGETDLRSYDDLYNVLKQYKNDASKYLKKVGNDYHQPDGSIFGSIDSALNNMWRLKKKYK
jgi:hypothetical protein